MKGVIFLSSPCDRKAAGEAAAEAERKPACTECPATAYQTVCMRAKVDIVPDIQVGKPRVTCLDGPFIGCCCGAPSSTCSFYVSQKVCVKVPIAFSAKVTARADGFSCEKPSLEGCKKD